MAKKAARASKNRPASRSPSTGGDSPPAAAGSARAAGTYPFEYMRGGAGTRKTSLLCVTALDYLVGTSAHPSTLVLTTYSRDAAGQLLDRLRSLALQHSALTWQQKRAILKNLDAATISTNHALGRAAVEHHWLERSGTPAAVVVGNATRAELIASAIDTVRRSRLNRRQRRVFDRLVARLGRGEAERRKQLSAAGHVADDIRQLVDMIAPSGMGLATFVNACEAEIDALRTTLAGERARQGVTATRRTLVHACRHAVSQLRPHPSAGTGATRDALAAMEHFLTNRTWHALHKLTTAKGVTRGASPPTEPIVTPVRTIAQAYHLFPEFGGDLKRYVRFIARIAHLAYQEYYQLLARTGRIDFAEMEQAFNKLLDDPVIRQGFCAKYGFVGIDEAQDMTAASAGAFGKVTETVRRGAWIADPNQSIYGFRGADYRGVQAEARRLVTALAGRENTQNENNRSPPGVIRFVNDLFETLKPAGACPARPLPTSHVQDAPAAGGANGRVERWLLKGPDEAARFAEVAEGVHRLRTAGPTSLKDEDICVLVRTQDSKRAVAAALAARGIPVAVRSAEVVKSREGIVLLSALRLLCNHEDRLAEATLRFLLDHRAAHGTGNPDFDRWLVDTMTDAPGATMTPSLAALLDARDRGLLPALSPSAAVLLAIEATGLIGRLAAWGECIERQSRIDTMLALARAYEKREVAAGRLATVAGFIVELEREKTTQEKEEPESEPPPKDMPGVRVMTFHASKGLGFKATIAVALKLSSRVERPHGIRFIGNRPVPIPWPLKDRDDATLDAIMRQLPTNVQRLQEALADETQLLYVALTRSAHTLIIAHPDDPEENTWLSAIFGVSDPAAGSLAGIDLFLPRSTSATHVVHPTPAPLPPAPGAALPAADYAFVDDLATVTGGPAAAAGPPTVHAIISSPPRRLSDVGDPPRYRSPSGNRTTSCAWNQADPPVNLPLPAGVPRDLVNGAVRRVAGKVADAFGDAIHAFMAAIPSLPPLDPADMAIRALWDRVAGRCLQSYLEPSVVTQLAAAGITAPVLVDRGQAFVEWCRVTFGVEPVDWTVEAGVAGSATSGGTWRGRIDLLFEARTGIHAGKPVLVDHKAVMTQGHGCGAKAAEYFGELSAYAEALAGATPTPLPPDGIYVHFPLAGVAVPLKKR